MRPSPRRSQGELAGGAVAFSPEDFPLIDRIARVDLRREQLEAFRILFPGEGPVDRGSPAPQVRRAPSGLSRHGSGDLHGSRPAPVSPPAGARSSPGALPGHDRMSAWGAADGENLLPPSRHLPAGGMVRGLSLNPGDLPHRQIDGPFHPGLPGPGEPRWWGRRSRGGA